MKLLVAAGAVATAVVFGGCGSSSSTRVVSPPPQCPTWGSCRDISSQITDYAVGAPGAKSVEAALAPYRTDGDHVVRRPAQPHQRAAWLLVDDQHVIHASLELFHTPRGWLVDTVEKCAD